MSKFVVYVQVEPYLKQWLTHSFGDPVEFPSCSNENAVLRRFLAKRPVNNQPEQPGERDVAISIPYSKSKSPETYNFLNGHAKQALTESIREGQGKIFSEDLEMLERQQQNLLAQPQRNLLKLNIDAGGVQSRKIIERLIALEQGEITPVPAAAAAWSGR